jgi:tRNA(Leu) C34 or U34 (ribose-2'-O)-methylase TrmL
MMVVDWTISVGNMIQLVALIGAALSVFYGLSFRLKGVEREVEKLAGVVVTLAVQTTRIDHLQQRIEDIERERAPDVYPHLLKRHQV